ncbi:MAG: hypothetical protein ACLQU5_09125 [Isosphaeraceae bacterium]
MKQSGQVICIVFEVFIFPAPAIQADGKVTWLPSPFPPAPRSFVLAIQADSKET